jgi:hypothetical protein
MRTRGLKVKDEKFCELQMQVKNAAEGNEWGSDAYGRSECEQAAERDEYQPTDALDTYETEEPGCLLSPSRMSELQEKGTFHVKMMAAKNSALVMRLGVLQVTIHPEIACVAILYL